MIEHLVLFKLRSDADADAGERVLAALVALPAAIESIRELSCGRNVSERGGGYDLALRVQFADWAGLEAYLPHPAHQAAVAQVIRPVVEEVLVADYETG